MDSRLGLVLIDVVRHALLPKRLLSVSSVSRSRSAWCCIAYLIRDLADTKLTKLQSSGLRWESGVLKYTVFQIRLQVYGDSEFFSAEVDFQKVPRLVFFTDIATFVNLQVSNP